MLVYCSSRKEKKIDELVDVIFIFLFFVHTCSYSYIMNEK